MSNMVSPEWGSPDIERSVMSHYEDKEPELDDSAGLGNPEFHADHAAWQARRWSSDYIMRLKEEIAFLRAEQHPWARHTQTEKSLMSLRELIAENSSDVLNALVVANQELRDALAASDREIEYLKGLLP